MNEMPINASEPLLTTEQSIQKSIADAYRMAGRMLADGTAPPSIVLQFIKMGESRYQYENERLQSQCILLNEKAEAIKEVRANTISSQEVIDAVKVYNGL